MSRRRLLPLLLAVVALVPLARAQHYLLIVEENDTRHVVRGAVATSPDHVRAEISNQGGAGLRVAQSTSFLFAEAPLWGRGFVDVSRLKVEIDADKAAITVHGSLQSDSALSHCFVVLLAQSPAVASRDPLNDLEVYPIPETGKGTLMPVGHPLPFDHDWNLPSGFDLRHGVWELHFFSNGLEIPTTQLTADQLAAARAKSEAYLLRNHPDSPIALRQVVNPIYPDALKAQRLDGSATLRCQVDRDGNVSAVEVVSATNPAFGQAAVEAVRQWKFTPAVQNHHYVGQTAELPLNFKAPPFASAAADRAPHP
jgi:TonB family protein